MRPQLLGRGRVQMLMEAKRARLLGACGVAVVAVSCGTQAVASAATWWPGATVFSSAARIGLAAHTKGGFLMVDGRGASEAAYCAPAAAAFALGGTERPPAERLEVYGSGGRVIPGSPSFLPDGRSVAMYLWQALHSEYGQVLEGPPSAPAEIAPVGSLSEPAFHTNLFVADAGVQSATGTRGDMAVAYVPNTADQTTIAVRPAGSAQWSHTTINGFATPKGLAVDGLGDTTVLANTFQLPGPVETASAYFAPAGGTFAPLAVPGNYFTAVAADPAGRSAIAGYTASGPDGPGLYLARRESPLGGFAAPVLLSSTSTDISPQLAYDAGGNLTVAWSDGGHIALTTAPPGRPVGPIQALYAPGATIASDEQLSVDAAGEAILVWAAGAHEEFAIEEAAGGGLRGVAAPLWASVRRSRSEAFGGPRELTASARYGDGLRQTRPTAEARAIDAISAGRGMVAWHEEGPSGPQVKAALYAAEPACASPPAPRSTAPAPVPTTTHPLAIRPRLRVTRARHPRRRRRELVLGSVSCPTGCSVATTVFAGSPRHRHVIALGSFKLAAHERRTVTAILNSRGLRLLRARPRLLLRIRIRVRAHGLRGRQITRGWSVRLSP
ncbi:MAG: hypothetical protein KGJ43_04170 [Acidobacteriota bacterium]|nr:hypothetical protein [Acidobacteriota bacterium]